MRGGSVANHYSNSSGIHDALSEVLKVYTLVKRIRGRHPTSFVGNESRRAIGRCLRCSESLRMRVGKTKLKLSLTEEGREGKSKVIASSKFLESKLWMLCKDEGIEISDFLEYLGMDIRNQTKREHVCAENWYHQDHNRIQTGVRANRHMEREVVGFALLVLESEQP